METRINIRTQSLIGSLTPKDGQFSVILEERPQEKDILETRGNLFAVINIKLKEGLDLSLVSNILKDTLIENYFGILEGTPMQALEDALVSAKNKAFKAGVSEEGGEKSAKIEINISLAVLWGRVLYVAQTGDTSAVLFRDGVFKVLGKDQQGEIKITSGIVEQDDILILSTSEFAKKYPEDVVLKMGSKLEEQISRDFNKESLSAIVISTSRMETLGKEESLNIEPLSPFNLGINTKEKNLNIKVKNMGSNLFSRRSNNAKKGLAKNILALLFLLAVFLAVSLYVTFKRESKSENVQEITAEKTDTELPLSNPLLDEENVFYDMTSSGLDTFLSKISGEEETLALLGSQGAIYTLNTTSLDIAEVKKLTIDIVDISFFDKNIFAVGSSGVYSGAFLLNDITQKTVLNDLPNDFISLDIYLGNIYLLSPRENQIYKLTPTGSGYAVTPWLKEDYDLSTAVDIAVSFNIFILRKDGALEEYLVGVKQSFSLLGEEKPSKPVAIYTTSNIDNIYILDGERNAVFVYGKDGSFKLKLEIKSIEDLLDLYVQSDEQKVFVITATKIYSVDTNF